MFRLLVILFLTVPLLEIFLLLKVGSLIGALWTVLLVVLTAVIGVSLLRMQGISTINRLQACTARGEPPAIPLIEGAFLLFAGALLLTPGFFTDGIGFLLLIPSVRQRLAIALLKRGVWFAAGQGGVGGHRPASQRHDTIEGEFERRDDER